MHSGETETHRRGGGRCSGGARSKNRRGGAGDGAVRTRPGGDHTRRVDHTGAQHARNSQFHDRGDCGRRTGVPNRERRRRRCLRCRLECRGDSETGSHHIRCRRRGVVDRVGGARRTISVDNSERQDRLVRQHTIDRFRRNSTERETQRRSVRDMRDQIERGASSRHRTSMGAGDRAGTTGTHPPVGVHRINSDALRDHDVINDTTSDRIGREVIQHDRLGRTTTNRATTLSGDRHRERTLITGLVHNRGHRDRRPRTSTGIHRTRRTLR